MKRGRKETGRVKTQWTLMFWRALRAFFPSFIHEFQSPHPCMNLSLIINSFLLFEIDIFSSYSVIQMSFHCVTPMRPFKKEWEETCLKFWSGEVGKSLIHSPFPYSKNQVDLLRRTVLPHRQTSVLQREYRRRSPALWLVQPYAK